MTDKIVQSIDVDHIARIEGKAGIEIHFDGNEVTMAHVNVTEGPRFFEAITLGKPIEEAVAVFPRVCSFCAAAHKITAVLAAEAALGITPSKQTMKLRELCYLGDHIESHALHLFFLALPDFFGVPDIFHIGQRHKDLLATAIALKDIGADIQTAIGSRYIHQENLLIGGLGRVPTKRVMETLADRLKGLFNQAEDALEVLVGFPSWPEVEADRQHLAVRPHNDEYGVFGDHVEATDGTKFKTQAYRMRIKETVVPYSFAKHGSYQDKKFMTGAISRFTLFGDLLSERPRELAEMYREFLDGRSPLANNVAQAIEIIQWVRKAHDIARALSKTIKDEERPPIKPKRERSGVAVTEAPRGMLAYTIKVNTAGVVTNTDIITPTAMFLPVMEEDLHRMATALLQAGTEKEVIAQKLQTIVRSYDPCVSCSVHLTTAGDRCVP